MNIQSFFNCLLRVFGKNKQTWNEIIKFVMTVLHSRSAGWGFCLNIALNNELLTVFQLFLGICQQKVRLDKISA